MADRRYAPLKSALPGNIGFNNGEMEEGDFPVWNSTDSKWELSHDAGYVVIGNTAGSDATLYLQEGGTNKTRIFWDASAETLKIRATQNSALLSLQSLNSGGSTTDILLGDPDGDLDLYSAGVLVARITDQSIETFSATSVGTTGYAFNSFRGSDDARWGWIGFGAGTGELWIENEVHGGAIRLVNEDSLGSAKTMLHSDGDGAISFYFTGIIAGQTQAGGFSFFDTSGNDPYIDFYQDDTTTRNGFIQFHGNGNLILRNEVHGGNILLGAENTSGTTKTLLNLASDGDSGNAGGGVRIFAHFDAPTTGDVVAIYGNAETGDLDQASSGLLLYGDGMNTTSRHTPALMFGSADGDFTTTSPKTLAGIAGRATQTYSNDSTGGMSVVIYGNSNNPGTAPTLVEFCEIAGNGTEFGTPTGGKKGVGTINAKAVYDDNVILTCLPVEEATGRDEGRVPWDSIFPEGRNLMVDQYEHDQTLGLDGTAQGWKTMMETTGSVPGLPNRREIERRWMTVAVPVEQEDHPELGPVPPVIESHNDKMSLSEVSNRQWLALDYMAVALRDAINKIDELEEQLNGNTTPTREPGPATPPGGRGNDGRSQ